MPGFALASVFFTSLTVVVNVSAMDWFDIVGRFVLMDG
jgi:hypothetical protein